MQGEVMNAARCGRASKLNSVSQTQKHDVVARSSRRSLMTDRTSGDSSSFTLLGYAGAVDSRLKQAAIESEVLIE